MLLTPDKLVPIMNEKISTQRVAKRFPTKEPARIEVIGRKVALFCRMTNLSSTGAFFEILNSNYTPRPNDQIRVTVNLKRVNKSHSINGQVVWCNGSGLGVVFNTHKVRLKIKTIV